jgi:hypothetical protein
MSNREKSVKGHKVLLITLHLDSSDLIDRKALAVMIQDETGIM